MWTRQTSNTRQRAAKLMVFRGRSFGGRFPSCADRAAPHESHLAHENALGAQKRTRKLFSAFLRCFCAVSAFVRSCGWFVRFVRSFCVC